MLTSTAGEVSSATANAAPVASARTFSGDTVSLRPAQGTAAFLLWAAARPKLRSLPIIVVVSFGRFWSAGRLLTWEKSNEIRSKAMSGAFTLLHDCVNIVLIDRRGTR